MYVKCSCAPDKIHKSYSLTNADEALSTQYAAPH